MVVGLVHEPDGDWHVDLKPTRESRELTDARNRTAVGGALVTEIMPSQDLPVPILGESVAVFGTWVDDRNHGWNEIHPIWAMDYGQGLVKSLPPVKPVYEPGSSGGGGSGGTGGGGGGSGGSSDCTPGYSPCLVYHGGADYDCAGGSGSGPYYTAAGVTYRVSGSDPYGLDSDGDGLGCE